MFILKIFALCVLVAAPALASAVKGGRLQTDTLKTPKLEAQTEQREEPLLTQQLVEQEPASQVKEEAPRLEESKRYEARPLVAREEQATRGQARAEQRTEERIEQLPRAEYESQQVEVREGEQRRLDDSAEPLAYEQQHEQALKAYQQRTTDDKSSIAPAGQAEPYSFSYQVEGSSRSESSDANGVVKGQYTIEGADGPSRVVDYVADQNGFRASVNTNEFGTESNSAANVVLRTSQPSAEEITMRLEGKTKLDFAAPAAGVKGAPAAPARRLESAPTKGAAPQPPVLRVPAPLAAAKEEPARAVKGQRVVQYQQQQEQEPVAAPEQAPKSAPLRGAKTQSYASEPRVFESGAAADEPARAVKVQRVVQYQQQQEQEPAAAPEQAAGSGPLRGAKTLSYASEPRVFESATAHRVYRGPAPTAVVRPAPAVLARRDQPPSVLRDPLARGYAHRYPPSPVLGYRRQQVALEPAVGVNPRVSFYGPASPGFEDELQVFERPEI